MRAADAEGKMGDGGRVEFGVDGDIPFGVTFAKSNISHRNSKSTGLESFGPFDDSGQIPGRQKITLGGVLAARGVARAGIAVAIARVV